MFRVQHRDGRKGLSVRGQPGSSVDKLFRQIPLVGSRRVAVVQQWGRVHQELVVRTDLFTLGIVYGRLGGVHLHVRHWQWDFKRPFGRRRL